jgi:hypothetical protein
VRQVESSKAGEQYLRLEVVPVDGVDDIILELALHPPAQMPEQRATSPQRQTRGHSLRARSQPIASVFPVMVVTAREHTRPALQEGSEGRAARSSETLDHGGVQLRPSVWTVALDVGSARNRGRARTTRGRRLAYDG